MPLTEQYLRYSSAGNFNIVASSNCNVILIVLNNEAGRYVAVGASEDILVWDMRLGEKVLVLNGDKHQVTYLTSSVRNHLAAGYDDGTVRTFVLDSVENNPIAYSGHRSAVTCLVYDSEGHRLVSGSKDNNIIIWDVVAECGLLRLTGHQGPVTKVEFVNNNILVSSSKDELVKLWDLVTGHCFETLTEHRTEVWGLAVMNDGSYLVTGSSENELKIWSVEKQPETEVSPLKCSVMGTILRYGRGRVVSLMSDSTSQILACHGRDGLVELFHFLPNDEILLRKKKLLKKHGSSDQEANVPVKDIVTRLPVIRVDGSVKNIDVTMGHSKEIRIVILLANNRVELHAMLGVDKDSRISLLSSLNSHGHHSEVRALAFSSDNLGIASGAAEQVKLWNRISLSCLQTTETSYVLSLCFVPGDRHLLVGLKDGHCLIIDISSQSVIENIPAHTKELWTLSLTPDQNGFITGSGDCTVKFWKFELVDDVTEERKVKILSALHVRTLKLEDGVLALKVSPNSRLIAVALLDSTVKIFFMDTLKFFLSLYGHSLPVLCLDISYDSTLIATGSADRNVKIWGLDFGDCHKSLFAHDDSVTGLVFVPKTHLFFTCGKDGKIKEWDADTFNKVQTLPGHHGEAWCIAVNSNGHFVVSAGSDRVLRLYERTPEPLVLEDEAEEERGEDTLATGEETIVPGSTSLNLPSKKTISSEEGAERLLECLKTSDSAGTDEKYISALMSHYNVSTPEDFLVENLLRIKSSDLEESLAILPFTSACELLALLCKTINKHSDKIELLTRTAMFILKIHHRPLVANQVFLSTLSDLEASVTAALGRARDMVGFNLNVLLSLKDRVEQQQNVLVFENAAQLRRNRDKKVSKREKGIKRAILSL